MISSSVAEWFKAETGISLRRNSARSVSGGCINEASLVETTSGRLIFFKSNHRNQLPLFESEKASLELLQHSNTVRVPEPLCLGVVDQQAIFALEGLQLSGRSDDRSQELLAESLAELHQHRSETGKFGASFDNYIGATPQPNPWNESWAEFFVENRLAYQLQLAESRCRKFAESPRLLNSVKTFLDKNRPEPSLLHGDLWGGNVSFDETGRPVFFDPASYYGDAEADLAFTRLFGGFGNSFYKRYREIRPPTEPVRETIYNLYHLLNHFNLFGGSYAVQADQSIQQILAELG